jgi:hypothetical protein
MYENNATTNAILVILLVLVVGFIVWFMVGRNTVDTGTGGPTIDVDLNGGGLNGGNDGGTGGGTQY